MAVWLGIKQAAAQVPLPDATVRRARAPTILAMPVENEIMAVVNRVAGWFKKQV